MIFTLFYGFLASMSMLISLSVYGMEQEGPLQHTPAAHKQLNPVIYQVSQPCSGSVACTRSWQKRGDTVILHEHAELPYFAQFPQVNLPKIFKDTTCDTFDAVHDEIIAYAETSPVFVKEMSPAAHAFIKAHPDFFKQSYVYPVFLVRNPHGTIISFYKKFHKSTKEFNPTLFKALLGFDDLAEVWKAAQAAANSPFVLLDKELDKDPARTLERLCNHLGMPYLPEALSWEPMTLDTFRETCLEKKKGKHVLKWHGTALASTGFRPSTSYEVNAYGEPTFSEIENPDHLKVCREIYQERLPHYTALEEVAKKQIL